MQAKRQHLTKLLPLLKNGLLMNTLPKIEPELISALYDKANIDISAWQDEIRHYLTKSGSLNDSFGIVEHTLPLAQYGLDVALWHTPITGSAGSARQQAHISSTQVVLGTLPPRLVSTMIEHLSRIAAKGSGFDPAWKRF